MKDTVIIDAVGLKINAYSSVKDMLILLDYISKKGYDQYMKIPNGKHSMTI
jgi:hypothetical protein